MIKTKEDLKYYLEQDRLALKKPRLTFARRVCQFFYPNEIWKFERLLRYTEYCCNCRSMLRIWYMWRIRRQSIKLGFSIPINVFGPGLSIAHYGTIVVNSHARVGANCRIHVGVNIGKSGGGNNAPKIGDNCYIGPGAIIFGDINIANNITIGANSTVNRSCDQERVVLAGTPAKVVKEQAKTWVEYNNMGDLNTSKK